MLYFDQSRSTSISRSPILISSYYEGWIMQLEARVLSAALLSSVQFTIDWIDPVLGFQQRSDTLLLTSLSNVLSVTYPVWLDVGTEMFLTANEVGVQDYSIWVGGAKT